MHLGASDKCHWEFYVKKDSGLKPKTSDKAERLADIQADRIPSFEVKIGNGVMFGAPSIHPDGTKYEFLGVDTPQVVDGSKIQNRINNIAKKYNLKIKSNDDGLIPIPDLVSDGAVVMEGHDRSQSVLRFVDSLCRRLDGLNLADDYFINAAFWFYRNHAQPGYTDEKIKSTAMQSMQFIKSQIRHEKDAKYRKLISGNLENGVEDDCYWLVRYMITHLKMITKSKIKSKTTSWFVRILTKAKTTHRDTELYGSIRSDFPFEKIVDSVFVDEDILLSLQDLAREYGRLDASILLDKDQELEAALYLLEKFHIKKHGLDGSLIYYNGIHYDDKTEAFVNMQTQKLMIRPKIVNLREVYNHIRTAAKIITIKDIMEHSHIVVLLNGVYDIKTREFTKDFSPEYYVFDQIPYNYDETQNFDEIKKFVTDLIPDKKDRAFYYDFSSICFHPFNGIKFQLGLTGLPGTGKTELVILCKNVFGGDESAMVHDATLERIAVDATTRRDVSLGRINVEGDMNNLTIPAISNLKRFISQEAFTDRSIYDHSEKYRPTSRILFATNSLYEIPNKNDAEAIYDRTKLIRFNRIIRHDKTKEIKDYVQKIIPKEEYNGYVTFLLHNASDIWERQDTRHPLDPSEARDIWNEFGNFIKKFAKKFISEGSGLKTKAQDVWMQWNDFVFSSHIDKKPNRNEFYKMFEEILEVDKDKIRFDDNVVWGYHGIALKTEKEIEFEEQQTLDTTK